MYESKTVAQVYTLALGLVFVAIGIAGFVAQATIAATGSGSFDDAPHVTIFTLDPWHSGLYTLAGLLGLATWRRADSARVYTILLGAIYLVVAGCGFVELGFGLGHRIFGLMDVRPADNILHAAISLASMVIGFTSPRHGTYPLPRTAELA